MKGKINISDSEWEVMKLLWKQGEPIKQPQLLELCEKEGKEWKRQTLNTFLARLEEKGLVKRESGYVSTLIGEEEFNFHQMKEAINSLYGGKLSKFVAAFSKENAITKEDAEELYEIINAKRG